MSIPLRPFVFILLALVCACHPAIHEKSKKNSEADARIREMQGWFYRLVKNGPDPIYIFETDTIDKKDGILQDYTYYLVDLDVDYREVPDGPFDSLFILSEALKARKFIENKKVSASKIFLQIPVATDDLDVDAILHQADHGYTPGTLELMNITESEFRDLFKMSSYSHDSLIAMNVYFRQKRTQFQRALDDRFYQFSIDDVNQLVENDRYHADFNLKDIPKPLIDRVRARLRHLIALLPDSLQHHAAKADLFIGSVSAIYEAPKLWMNNKEGKIYISPALFRAAVIQDLAFALRNLRHKRTKQNKIGNPVKLVANYAQVVEESIDEKPRKGRSTISTLEFNTVYPLFIESFDTKFDFVLLHELGHSLLAFPDSLDEEKCDCFAIGIMKREFEEVRLGIFESLVLNTQSSFWNRPRDNAKGILSKRYDQISTWIQELGPLACD